jgi:hypothetical protein
MVPIIKPLNGTRKAPAAIARAGHQSFRNFAVASILPLFSGLVKKLYNGVMSPPRIVKNKNLLRESKKPVIGAAAFFKFAPAPLKNFPKFSILFSLFSLFSRSLSFFSISNFSFSI